MKVYIKRILIVCLLLATFAGIAQEPPRKPLRTDVYGGIYEYGDNSSIKTAGKVFLVYPESDTTVLFYYASNDGEPKYNLVDHYGRLRIKNDSGIYFYRSGDLEKGCKWQVIIKNKVLTVKTLDNCNECGIRVEPGNPVITKADHAYKLTGTYFSEGKAKFEPGRFPQFFTDRLGNCVFFKKVTPEQYVRLIKQKRPIR